MVTESQRKMLMETQNPPTKNKNKTQEKRKKKSSEDGTIEI